MGKSWKIEFPPNEIEWPDLLVSEGSKTFGIEVREITKDKETKKGSKRRATESRNRQKINDLIKNYYAESKVPIKVNILGPIDEGDNLLVKLISFAGSSDVWKSDRIEINPKLHIHVTRLPDEVGQYTHWDHVGDRVGWVRKIDSEYIMPFVLEKEKRISKYKTHFEDVRLLLVADRTFSSGMLEMQEGDKKIKSLFSELYLFEYPYKVHTFSS